MAKPNIAKLKGDTDPKYSGLKIIEGKPKWFPKYDVLSPMITIHGSRSKGKFTT